MEQHTTSKHSNKKKKFHASLRARFGAKQSHNPLGDCFRRGAFAMTVLFAALSLQTFAITDALKIKIARGSYSDETIIRFVSGATEGFDGSYDAWKLFSGNASVPNIFSKDNVSDELTINARPEFLVSTYQDVYLKIGTAATYTISAEETGAFAPGVCIMMKDLTTGQLYDMRTMNTYLISLPLIAQTDPARFRVFFSYPGSVQTTRAACNGCSDGTATITKAGEINWLYSVVNASGNNVASGVSSGASQLISGLAVGNYTATISSDHTCLENISFTINGPVTYYSRASGNWSDANTWSIIGCGGAVASSVPGSADNVEICSGNSVTIDAPSSCIDITISSGTLSAASSFSVTGNWVSNGTFAANTHSVHLTGNRLQEISGSSSLTFNNLRINNSAPAEAVRLNMPVTVAGAFELKDGHVTTTAATILTCGASSSISLLCIPQDSSFVKGPISHIVNVNTGIVKVFPVGKGNAYRRIDLTVDQKFSTAATYTAEMIDSSAQALGYSLPATISNVSYVRYHEITQDPSTTKLDMAQVRVYFGCSGTDDNVQSLPPISVAQDNGSSAWVDLTDTPNGFTCGSSYWGSALSGTFTSFAGTKFSLTNTGDPVILGVALMDFDAQVKNKSVNVSWKTASESNSDHFTIERSANGNDFSEIGMIKAAGNSTELLRYDFSDEDPLNGRSYYRLRETDGNGVSSVSYVVSVTLENENLISVYPNPASDFLNIIISGSKDKESTVVIRDILGRECYSQKVTPSSDAETVQVDIAGKLSQGLYSASVISNEKTFEQKLIIK